MLRIIIALVFAIIVLRLIFSILREWPKIKATVAGDLNSGLSGSTTMIDMVINYFRQRPFEGVVFILLIAIMFIG